jgi:S1-C subfamily serine protease
MPVEGDGPARQAGLREGDLIVAINECMVNSIDYLHRFLADWPIGDPVTLTVLRGKERFTLKVSPVEAK